MDARWTFKSKQYHYGYKLHMSLDLQHGFILNGHITGANASDNKEFIKTIHNLNIKKGSYVLADKGYPSRKNSHYLKENGLIDWIMLESSRNKKLSFEQKLKNSRISKPRSSIERIFGNLKSIYGLNRSKYLGILKNKSCFLLTAIAYNLKKTSTFVLN